MIITVAPTLTFFVITFYYRRQLVYVNWIVKQLKFITLKIDSKQCVQVHYSKFVILTYFEKLKHIYYSVSVGKGRL